MSPPILYSFRRCPYAIRARMALVYSAIPVELREVRLRELPDCMLQKSPKATVPVLVLEDGRVIDESIDVMHWCLEQSDPQQWLAMDTAAKRLIEQNDTEFKPLLDCYKYADRHPQSTPLEHRARAEIFVSRLDAILAQQSWLGGDRCRLADVAIFPFIRQFAGVDDAWFEVSGYAALREWLKVFLRSDLFLTIMRKQPFWSPGEKAIYLAPGGSLD